MKLLIPALLLCAVMAQAQDSVWVTGHWYHFSHITNPIWGSNSSIKILPLPTPITREDLFSYAQECYADSATQRTHVGKPGEYCLVDWECLIESHYKMVTTHCEPTFKGFVEWLRKRP